MDESIRVLHGDDYSHLETMDTGIEDDYIKQIFDKLVTGNDRLYGYFLDGQLVSMGGYSIYADSYAMLGRLRSDRRYKKKGFSTMLMSQMMNEAFQLDGINWVGANTQEENAPARRVMEKVGLTPRATHYGAIASDTTALESGAGPWNLITDIQSKQEWVDEVYVKASIVFPYECYYRFPATKGLFQEDNLKQWSFFENDAKTRVLITKADQKKHHYLHAIYPWNDITSQSGLWETIAHEYKRLNQLTEGSTYIWLDLTKEQAQSLPTDHPFDLPSPWILYGKEK